MPVVTLDRPIAEDAPAGHAPGFGAEIRRMRGADPAPVPKTTPAPAKAGSTGWWSTPSLG